MAVDAALCKGATAADGPTDATTTHKRSEALAIASVDMSDGTASVLTNSAGGGGGSVKPPGPTYTQRLMRLVFLMDPRHTLTTEADIEGYRKLLSGKVRAGTLY